jgi:hypothetical protein
VKPKDLDLDAEEEVVIPKPPDLSKGPSTQILASGDHTVI